MLILIITLKINLVNTNGWRGQYIDQGAENLILLGKG